jgi:hypothetical protein
MAKPELRVQTKVKGNKKPTSSALNESTKLPNPKQLRSMHRSYTIALWVLLTAVLAGLFIFVSQSVEVTQARVVSPPRIPVAPGSGNPMAPRSGGGVGGYGYGYNPLDDYQNPLAPKVKGEIGPALNRRLSQARDQLPVQTQSGLNDIFDRNKVSLDKAPVQTGPNITNPDSQTCNFANGKCFEAKNRLVPGNPTGVGYDLSGPNPVKQDSEIKVRIINGKVYVIANGYLVASGNPNWGLLEFSINNKTGLTGKRGQIPEHLRVKGNLIFDHLLDACLGLEDVETIKGNWTPQQRFSDNFNSFEQNLRRGLSPEEAARNTFTGKVAGKRGYTEVEIDYHIPGEEAYVWFRKPESR